MCLEYHHHQTQTICKYACKMQNSLNFKVNLLEIRLRQALNPIPEKLEGGSQ